MKSKIRIFFHYIYWLGAKVQYKHFGENGTNGIFVIAIIINFIIFDLLSFFRVLFYNHKSLDEILGGDYSVYHKIFLAGLCILVWNLLEKYFKGIPILNHPKFKITPERKRIFHTFLLYLSWVFLFYVMLIIYSPDFHPKQLKFW